MSFSVLIVDDQQRMCVSLQKLLNRNGFDAHYTTDATAVMDLVCHERPDVVIMDIQMPRTDGLDLLQRLRRISHDTPVLMISGVATIENAVEAMRLGARNFYQKPIQIGRLLDEIRALEKQKHLKRNSPLQRHFLTHSESVRGILDQVHTVAATDAPVVITGESGTGKELIAAEVHDKSKRCSRPFIKINCASLPDTLIESELFGHERGAFTDAHTQREGKFEAADGGTLFFDEIAELSLSTQAKLLRVLQEREYERLGSNETRTTDTRIIAATNASFDDLIARGSFREDLFYRLSVVRFELPPLRERPEDILLLAEHFLGVFNTLYGKDIAGFSDQVRRIFLNHTWPGNVRELRNTVERAVIFSPALQIGEADLPAQYYQLDTEQAPPLRDRHDSVTREMILDALRRSNGIKQDAAILLGIHRKTLYNKMRSLGISG